MIIDHQAHWYPPAYLDQIAGRTNYPRSEKLDDGSYHYEIGSAKGDWRFTVGEKFTSIEHQINAIDAAGIGAMVLSPNMVADGAAWVDLDEAKEILSFLNEETARVQREYPGRILGMAMLPMQDADASIELLDKAVELDLRGVLMPSNIAGGILTEKKTWPIFERLNELELPIFIHPASNSMLWDKNLPDTLDSSAGWMYDTSVAILSMILSGVLDQFPKLEVVHSHMGGVVPYVVGRVSRYASYNSVTLKHSVEHYLKTRTWVDMVTHTPGAIALASDFYGPDRLLYGADHPWHDHPSQLAFLEQHMTPEGLHKMLHENRVPSLRLG